MHPTRGESWYGCANSATPAGSSGPPTTSSSWRRRRTRGAPPLRQADPFVVAATLSFSPYGRAGEPVDWLRQVDLGNGVVRHQWSDAAGTMVHEVLASRADDMIVVRIRGGSGGVSGILDLAPIAGTPPVPVDAATAGPALRLKATFPKAWPGAITGYHVECRAMATGGAIRPDTARARLIVQRAPELLLLLRTTIQRAGSSQDRSSSPRDVASTAPGRPTFTGG
jgi:hypothetical protein